MEGYEDDFCYDDDDFEALDREMDQPPPAATLVTASTSSSSSSTSTSTSKHSDKLSNINNIHSKQTDAGRKGIHVEDFSQFDDLPNLTKAVTTRRPSMLTDSSSANQLLLSILPNTVINPDTVAKQEDIEVDSMSQYIIEPEFSVDEVHEAEESKAEKEDLVQTESAVTSQHAANGNDESFFNITKLTALKKKAQAKSFHKDHSPRLAEQQGTAESKEKEKEEVPESTSIPDQVSNKYNNVDIENDSAISKVVVPSNAIAKDPSINAIPTTQSTSKAIKPAPPIQPKPSRLKPVAAVKVHPEKIKNAKRSATEASKHGHVSPSISAASIVTSSESEAKVDVVSSMRQINFQHPSSDTVATNFSADHVDHAMLSEGEKRKVLGAEHDAHISFSLPVIELSQPTLHSHGGSEQDLIPETLQKAVESDAKQKPHPPASHKSEPPGKAAVHKAAPHRKKKQANKVDAVAKEKAKDWIKVGSSFN